MRRNDEVEAQRCRWTFYETIIFNNVPIQGRGAAGFVVGLGVRAVRAGNIGRDG